MTALPQPGTSTLSEKIAGPLRAVRSRQWNVLTVTGALRALSVALVVTAVAAILLGSSSGMPSWVRWSVAAIAWVATLSMAAHFLRPVLNRGTLSDAAFAVERNTQGLQERLSSTVELSGAPNPFAGSPLLLRHLARQAEADAGAVDPRAVVPDDAVRRWGLLCAVLAAVWLVLAIVTPRVFLGGVYRVLLPWRADVPALLAQVAVTPGDVTLAEGDPLEIKASLNGSGANVRRALLLTRPIASDGDHRPLARALDPFAPKQFRAAFEHVRESFAYQVSTEHGESPWFTATVVPRPKIAALDVRYDYPAYTGIDAKTLHSADGNLRALQGTDVTLTLHASEALDLSKSRLTVTEGSRQRTVELKPLDEPNAYEAKLTVFNSGSYRIQLVNSRGLANVEENPRTVVADLDRPPSVAIVAPPSQVTVRSDDDVPVLFKAGDDFGVSKVTAVVQVDDKQLLERDVRLAGRDRRQLGGQFPLSVAEQIAAAGAEDAKTITYWLKATDNRDPDPQTTESAKQTLKIDNGQSVPYRTRLEQEQAKDLIAAIDKTIQRLDQARGPVDALKHLDPNRAMNAGEQKTAEEQRDQLARTSKDLDDTAESNLRGAFNEIAAKAQAVAVGPIQTAAEDVARARLSADEVEPRKKAATEAVEQIADARKQLEELKKGVEARAKDVQAERELAKLAERQAQLAEAQQKTAQAKAAKPDANEQRKLEEARQKQKQRQRELADRLGRAIGQSEALRDPKSAEQAAKLRELLDRVQQIQRDQAQLQDQVGKQQQIAAVREKSDELAAKQRELNEAVEAFSEKRAGELRRADTRTPDRQHQAGIVDKLLQNEVEQARDMQKQSVEQLRQAAQRLKERGRSNQLKPDPVQQNALNVAEQAKQWAQQASEQANQAAQKLKEAKAANPANAEQTGQAQKAVEQAADALGKQARLAASAVAEAAQSEDPTAKKNAADTAKAADAAEAAADAAKQAAQEGIADRAAQKLTEASQQLVASRQKAADAIKADFVADQQAASKAAAEQAGDLAERQAALAKAAKEQAEALAKARKDQQQTHEVADRQNQLKDQTTQARQQADQLEQLAKSVQSPLAERVGAAEKLLDDAAAAEAEAAQQERAVVQAQDQSREQLHQAAGESQHAAQLFGDAAGQLEQAEAHRQSGEAARQNVAVAQARSDAGGEKTAQQQVEQEKQKAAEAEKRARDLQRQSLEAEQHAAAVVKQADAARKAAGAARGQAADKQAVAQDALARAEGALRDVDRMVADAARTRAARARTGDAKDPSASPSDAQPAADQELAAAADGQAAPPLLPEEALRQAALGAQEAAQAQQQSLNAGADSGNVLDASRQAAAALQQAAAAMAAANRSSVESAQSVASGRDEQAAAQGQGQAPSKSTRAGNTPDSHKGMAVAQSGTDERPASVQQLGISAGDWARLGPLSQQELLNAAQQNGPPAYREMIKNYYVRIARLDQEARAAHATEQRRDGK